MDYKIKNFKSNFKSISQLADEYLKQKDNSKAADSEKIRAGDSFSNILKRNISETEKAAGFDNGLTFSKHAKVRLESRNISLSKGQLQRLNDGANKAREKGINESLVVVDKLSFIVSVPNKTVITAMDQEESDENIYTNIDGAVIV